MNNFFSREVSSKTGGRTTEVGATIFFLKYMVTFSFVFVNRECNQKLPPVTFWKVDLLATAKWMLSPLFCVPTGLIVAPL